jgi:hypothetical protein
LRKIATSSISVPKMVATSETQPIKVFGHVIYYCPIPDNSLLHQFFFFFSLLLLLIYYYYYQY